MTLGQLNALIRVHVKAHTPKDAPSARPNTGTVQDLQRFRAMTPKAG